MARDFVQHGYTLVSPSKPAGVYVVNTFPSPGMQIKMQAGHPEAHKSESSGRRGITGCYAQLRAPEIQKIPGVFRCVGTNYRHR
jgi:tRNA A37 methylthiotransferase MiaB